MALQKGDRILVTGGAGYIGSHACKALAQSGFQPIVYDNLSTGHRDFVKWGPLVEGDILDGDRLAWAFENYQIGGVLHFAAASIVSQSVLRPHDSFFTNVAGTLTLLNAMLKANCLDFVFSSSCAVYGNPSVVPISEKVARLPVNPYGRSKLIIEDMLDEYRRAHGMRTMVLRYFNAAGADLDSELGARRDVETHLIPLAISALTSRKKLTIYGSDYDTPDGTAIRDYVHVSDLADAHVLALKSLNNGLVAGPFNLGTGRGYSVKEIVSEISKIAGKEVPTIKSGRRAGDPPILVADTSHSRDIFGFNCRNSSLVKIIETAFRWHQNELPAHL